MSSMQPANPPLVGERPLTDLESSWIARNRIALARLYEACLQADDEELEDEPSDTNDKADLSGQASGRLCDDMEVRGCGTISTPF